MKTIAPLAVVVLAAGKGTRMKSSMPKVLHPVAGAPMLHHALKAAQSLKAEKTVVITGFGAEEVESNVSKYFPQAVFARQTEQKGTGHAVQQAHKALKDFTGTILIFSGDSTLPTRPDVLPELLRTHTEEGNALTVLTADVPNPTGYGRVFKKGGKLVNVEHKDCSEAERKITTVNTSFYAVESKILWPLLNKIKPENAQNEYYLTDIIALAGAAKHKVGMACLPMEREEIGMNSRAEIAQMEALWQTRKRHEMMAAGVTLQDPSTVYFSHDTVIAADVSIGPNVVFGPGVTIESNVNILPFCHIEGAHVHSGARIGPFARLRPGTVVKEEAHIGNFVELKNTTLGKKSNANHLSYIGDATVGDDTNLGAGTITANYNHFTKEKFKTKIGNHVSTGALTSLVAPVTVGNDVYIGAGTTLRKDVEANTLVVTLATTKTKSNYRKRRK